MRHHHHYFENVVLFVSGTYLFVADLEPLITDLEPPFTNLEQLFIDLDPPLVDSLISTKQLFIDLDPQFVDSLILTNFSESTTNDKNTVHMDYNFDGFGDESNEERELYVVLQVAMQELYALCVVAYIAIEIVLKRYIHKYPRTIIRGPNRLQEQMDHINRLVRESDITCIEQLRMDRRCFMTLCHMVRTIGGLGHSKHVTLEKKMALFLYVLAHDLKIRKLKFNFFRSRETVSRHFNDVLKVVLRLQGQLLRTPNPITQECTDPRWNCLQNCLGALDGTYIKVRVPVVYQARYRTQKGKIDTNVLGVCSQDMNFIYVLLGWEGSAANSRVLRHAINRPNGLRIQTGYYYLVDAGYTNGQGFLAPYRGQRYHLFVWRIGSTPTNYQEFFNMKHASARNVIERCFGLLKI
ncbi:hypothetical protein ACSBR1_012659 [Camellia fascicularis]